MTPKEQALKDYLDGDLNPIAPNEFSHEHKAEFYREVERLFNNEDRRSDEELRAGV